RAVQDQVLPGREPLDRRRTDVHDPLHDLDGAVDRTQAARRGDSLGQPQSAVLLGEERLALQVRLVDVVAVGEGEPADAGPGQDLGGHGAEGAAADCKDAAFGDPPLTLLPDGSKQQLSGVTFHRKEDITSISKRDAVEATPAIMSRSRVMRFPSRRFLKIVAALLLLPSIVGGVFLIRYYYIFNGIIEGKLAKIHGQGENEIYAAPTTLFPGKRMPAPELLETVRRL